MKKQKQEKLYNFSKAIQPGTGRAGTGLQAGLWASCCAPVLCQLFYLHYFISYLGEAATVFLLISSFCRRQN